ncbi:MAG: DUF4833 domain-containing protein [Deltaproteobacteria bacterium]|nr:DUF4833 domain-containing protein [Deltaproteobacteria bacterium]
MLEDHPPRLEGLSFGEPRAYGVASQHVDAPSAEGTWIHLDLRALENRPIDVLALRNSSGHCVAAARMIIDGQVSYLHYVYVDVGGGLIPSVDYIDLHGRSVSLERSVSERIQR